MDVLNFGYSLLWVTVILLVAIVSLCLVGIQTRDRRYIKSARVGLYVNFILIFAAAGTPTEISLSFSNSRDSGPDWMDLSYSGP